MESNATPLAHIHQNNLQQQQQQPSQPQQLRHNHQHYQQYNGVINANKSETRKKTWTELRDLVTDLRKQLSKLSTMIPMNIEFRNLSDGRTRIYFLSTPPNGWETTLLCTDIPQLDSLDTSINSNPRQRLVLFNVKITLGLRKLCFVLKKMCTQSKLS